MTFPLNLSELNILLGIIALILLVASTLLLLYRGKAKILIRKKRLLGVSAVFLALFLITLAVEIVNGILGR